MALAIDESVWIQGCAGDDELTEAGNRVVGFGDVLAAMEENLILARELGVRTIECDRSLLSPLPKPEPPKPEPRAEPPKPTPRDEPPPRIEPPPAEPVASPPPSQPSQPSAPATSPLILLAGKRIEKGSEVDTLFGNMVLATGLAKSEFAFIETPAAPSREVADGIARRVAALKPKAVILFGSEAMKTFALAGCTARRGLWGAFGGIPAIATFHPEFMIKTWGNDEGALRKGKLEVWRVLKEALARIGRKPPTAKK